ncbi:unnamed protein product [Rhizophagus irregularis]|nr:unnamed protein product [Rhizophagus irregularis]
MSQLSPEDKSSNSENEVNSESESGSFSELDQRFSSKVSRKRTKHRYSPYIIPLEYSPKYSPTLENITMAGPSDVQTTTTASPTDVLQTTMAGLSDVQTTTTAGPTDVLQTTTAGPSDVQTTTTAGPSEIISPRKRKDEESTKSKEAKKAKLTPADNPKEKDTIKILSEDHYEVQQFLETIPANALKDGLVALKSMNGGNCKQLILDIDKQKLTAVLPSGSLNIKPTFYMSEKNFIEMEQERFENNPYILKRLPADSDNSNNNTTIGIELLYKEKITGENLKEDTLAVAWLIHHLKTVQDRLPYNPPIMQPNYNSKKYVQNL